MLLSVPNAATGIQAMANASDSQPITITNAQGQQITVIPTASLQQQLRQPTNANIIQMPNTGFVQNIPGLGNVQVKLLVVECCNPNIMKCFFVVHILCAPGNPGQCIQWKQCDHNITTKSTPTQ